MRKIKEGKSSSESANDSFVAELTGRAVLAAPKDQVASGALSDLLMFQYAEQSARIRARQGGLHAALYGRFVDWLNPRAAEAYQAIVGEAVNLPAPSGVGVDEVADAVLAHRLP